MKIDGVGDGPKFERPVGSAPAVPAPPRERAEAKVSLSDLAVRLQQIEAETEASAPFDAARVEEIKAAIREGRFKVNAEVVADRLIQSLKELLGPRP
ncbi:MAG: flagellar biosynthesis anti-sigma factor FlgM [Burkholderiales bacterium]|nr:flagellar biosynthesis anti-sigma factor FlgM [Burkholderiales bacterium]